MRRSIPILAVLLGASLLGNAMLMSRLSRRAEPDPAQTRKSADATAKPILTDETAKLRDSLEAEKKKNEELRIRIEHLETDKKVLAQDSTPGQNKADKLVAFRERLRKLFKVMKDPAAKAGAVDPDSMVELTETYMEFFKMAATRSKEPKAYADYLHAFYEIGLEGETTALSQAQSGALSKLFEDFGLSLSKVPSTPAGERLIKEVELEASTMARVRDLLTEPQRALLAKDSMNALAAGNMMSTSYISGQGGADQIATMWTQSYQLDASQQPQAKIAAQAYLDAMNRLDPDGKAKKLNQFDQSGSPESYEYRLRSLREQLAALNMLSASLTPAQQERLRTQTMREFKIIDPAAFTAPAAPAPEK